jgi:imidazolonepropionase-like amidohydrolase
LSGRVSENSSSVVGRWSLVGWDERHERPVTRWDLVRHMRDSAGIPVYITSDFFGRRIAEFPRVFTRLTSEAGVPPLELIRMVTQAPAVGLGIGNEVGTLEPGKRADFLLLDGDPTRDVAALTRVRAVFQGGRKVVEDGRVLMEGAG